ncbi:unnamed protein product [Leptosia nina]|uniref:Uncharacterized protein n=1 Tax=Leptosia nina TaxID=320188 RepID=A0AAV1JZS5_9NEOP
MRLVESQTNDKKIHLEDNQGLLGGNSCSCECTADAAKVPKESTKSIRKGSSCEHTLVTRPDIPERQNPAEETGDRCERQEAHKSPILKVNHCNCRQNTEKESQKTVLTDQCNCEHTCRRCCSDYTCDGVKVIFAPAMMTSLFNPVPGLPYILKPQVKICDKVCNL